MGFVRVCLVYLAFVWVFLGLFVVCCWFHSFWLLVCLFGLVRVHIHVQVTPIQIRMVQVRAQIIQIHVQMIQIHVQIK